jgi:prepilin-type N-terminal cleavage/methylation domain-containing protein
MGRLQRQASTRAGFTLVELLIVMGVIAVLGGLATVNLFQPQAAANVSSIVDKLVADLKSQQTKAMAGDTWGAGSAQEHGIYVQSGEYTLFKGGAYSAVDTDNIDIETEGGVTLSTTLPSTQVVFAKGSGEVNGFTNGSNTITITGTGGTKTVTINRYGAVTVN